MRLGGKQVPVAGIQCQQLPKCAYHLWLAGCAEWQSGCCRAGRRHARHGTLLCLVSSTTSYSHLVAETPPPPGFSSCSVLWPLTFRQLGRRVSSSDRLSIMLQGHCWRGGNGEKSASVSTSAVQSQDKKHQVEKVATVRRGHW